MSINREILTFVIIDRKIYYSDRKFGAMIRLIPKPDKLFVMIAKSRNRFPMFLANLFNLSKEEIEEYNSAKTTEDLANIIIRDAKRNGCLLVANGDMEADSELVDKISASEVIT